MLSKFLRAPCYTTPEQKSPLEPLPGLESVHFLHERYMKSAQLFGGCPSPNRSVTFKKEHIYMVLCSFEAMQQRNSYQFTQSLSDPPVSNQSHLVQRVNDTQALWKANKQTSCVWEQSAEMVVYSSSQSSAQITTRQYSHDSSFQRGPISKLDTGAGPVLPDEGKPMLSGIGETVTGLHPNEGEGYCVGYWSWFRWSPQTGAADTQ